MTPAQEAALKAAQARRAAKASQPATVTPAQQAVLDRLRAKKTQPAPAAIDGPATPPPPELLDDGTYGYRATTPAKPQGWARVKDVGDSINAGLMRGVASIAGFPGTVTDLANAGVVGAGKYLGVLPKDAQGLPPNAVSGQAISEYMSGATGGFSDYRGKTTLGQFAGTAAEFVPGAAAFGGLSAGNLLKYGVAPGLASEAAGQVTEGTAAEPYARAGAAFMAGPVAGLAERGARRLISPNGGADPARVAMADLLEGYGVPVTAGQRTGNKALQRREGVTNAGQEMGDAQREAFTAAALATTGTTATRASPEVLAQTAKRIGSVFDEVQDGVAVASDPTVLTALSLANDTYKSLAPTAAQAPIIGQVFKAFAQAYRKGAPIEASKLSVWRSSLSKLTASADQATRQAAIEALDAVDGALETALVAAGRSDDVARLTTARGQWRNYLAIARAASNAGEGAAVGILSPSALRGAVVSQGRMAYATGRRGDIGDLSRAGEAVIKPLPTSGTAENLRAMGVPALGWTGAGSALGFGAGDAAGAAAGAVIGAMVPTVAGAARMSPLAQRYLGNQVAGRGGPVLSGGGTAGVSATVADDFEALWERYGR